MVDAHFDFVWRSLRRLGVPSSFLDDAAQQVWIVVSRRLAEIDPARERAFLFGTAIRVASDARRAEGRRREVLSDDAQLDALPSERAKGADEALDERRARALLDDVLLAMPMELRAVFVLFELEELSSVEIAPMLGVPVGTVSSRLRRARHEFQEIVKRMRARGALPGAPR